MQENNNNNNNFGISKKANENSILNSISLNASRDRMSELFNDFKKLNIEESNKKLSTESNIISLSSTSDSKDIYNDAALKNTFNSTGTTDTTEISIPVSANSNVNTNANASSVTDRPELLKIKNISEPKVKHQYQHSHLQSSNFGSATTLYIGDLDPSIDDAALQRLFSGYKSLLSVKICYSPTTKKSFGYGYVNFSNESDAKKAMDDLNYKLIYGKEIRIMPYIKGKNKSFMSTNVFVSNLNVNHLSLRGFYEKFKHIGKILSCKLDLDKSQGFISFEDKETALWFVETYNSSVIDGSKIHCSIHIPKSIRQFSQDTFRSTNMDPSQNMKSTDVSNPSPPPLEKSNTEESLVTTIHTPALDKMKHGAQSSTSPPESTTTKGSTQVTTNTSTTSNSVNDGKFCQIYVKGLPVNVSDEEIQTLFGVYGSIREIYKESVPTFKSAWCFVTFKEHSSAVNAIESCHKVAYKGKKLTCVKALKKAERHPKDTSVATTSPRSLPLVTSNSINSASNGTSSTKLYIYNLPQAVNENFFKLFLAKYKLDGKALKFVILNNSKENYIEFEKRSDAETIHQKLNGVNLYGLILQTSLVKLENSNGSIRGSKSVSISSNSTTITNEKPANLTKQEPKTSSTTNFHPINHSQHRQGSQLHFVDEPISPPINDYLLPSDSTYNSTIQSAIPSIPSGSTNATGVSSVLPQPLIQNINGKQYKLVPLSNPPYISDSSLDVHAAYVMSKQSTSPMSYLEFYTTGLENESNEKLYAELERVSLRYIDFLKYPAATRPRNLKKILKYLLVTLWDNKIESVKESLVSIGKDSEFTDLFKTRLVGAIKLFGFER